MVGDVVQDWNGNSLMLRPGSYWHLTPAVGGLIRNNARAGKGVVYSVSAIAAQPGLSQAFTPYAAGAIGQPKEILWEQVRAQSYPALPSRLKSLYCFETKEIAERAAREWFGNEVRIPLELRIGTAAIMHRCDAKLLEAPESDWKQSAERYWKGEMTAKPVPETIVHGPVYFPGWEQFPIGF
ncbi:DUF2441 domain-containing protein [Bradyrhizobium sp. AUGA SZCCT0169]|uniref:DUF2441 domain-containing protein n=1 Tax=Bradyrhizobium sp. AUGA SZCCT0169 TaxID=2807663 RepID=UPI001BACA1F3|nr:DUF2441 domain-containing protein [Bradyrhizobium sp. AUGA SZCCT0169]MBR1249201.1 DUF2441 domain-containing protein [Bradyrhizobium sp. AUGA SZCCT0169]